MELRKTDLLCSGYIAFKTILFFVFKILSIITICESIIGGYIVLMVLKSFWRFSSSFHYLITNNFIIKFTGQNVCEGDSGGGLSFQLEELFYLMGIVSIGPRSKSGSCDPSQYTTFTKFSHHAQWADNITSLNRIFTWWWTSICKNGFIFKKYGKGLQ